jgi:hypothetical protein
MQVFEFFEKCLNLNYLISGIVKLGLEIRVNACSHDLIDGFLQLIETFFGFFSNEFCKLSVLTFDILIIVQDMHYLLNHFEVELGHAILLFNE